MARGWESKAVEMQIEERTAPPVAHGNHRAGAAEDRQRELLEMTRRRLLFELDAATHPRHREQKQKAITHLDEQLEQLRLLQLSLLQLQPQPGPR